MNGKVAYVKVQEIKVAREDKEILSSREIELNSGAIEAGALFPLDHCSPWRRACMTGTVQDVRDENYKEFTDSAGAVVAYGLATCEPCKQYDPILEETAAKFPNIKIGKAKMHVPGRCREIKKAHTFETYPTTHFFAHGKLLLTREGVVEPAELAALINDHLLK
ncbi:MAG: thioredoxin family protein [Nitrospira sp.]|nr:thioredoxin family protein [Nitrospira sp.]